MYFWGSHKEIQIILKGNVRSSHIVAWPYVGSSYTKWAVFIPVYGEYCEIKGN